ncbi:MAG: hypothetical protein ISS81_11175 [Candidatus Marinimicrobia bacterium]|nr:hypothetical protein [Candidatus Neomarinimicrobiota bacterium]
MKKNSMQNDFGKINYYLLGIVKVILTFSLLIIVSGCSNSIKQSKPAELIRFLTIESGKIHSVPIDELFYSPDYKLKFENNPYVNIQYDSQLQKISLKPNQDFSGLTLIQFSNKNKKMVLPVIVKKKIEVTFCYKPEKKVFKVFVMGNFNNWNRNSLPMFDKNKNGIFERTVLLDDGVYEYQFVVDKSEIWDPVNPEKVDNGFGSFNSLLRVKSAQKENAPSIYFQPYKNNHTIRIAVAPAKKEGQLKLTILKDNEVYPSRYSDIKNNIAQINLSPLSSQKGISIIRIVATCNNQPGNILSCCLNGSKLGKNTDTFLWQDAIIYSLMIDRFYNGNPTNDNPVQHPELDQRANFNGGDLAGIIQKIEEGYFDNLGINTLWISPVNKTTNKAYKEWPEPHRYFTGYHGYWPVSATETEPRFGSMGEFKNLVNVAHKHGIKVLLDFVSNHTHKEHIFFQKHRDWFGTLDLPDCSKNIRKWNEYMLTTWFDTFLPSFDYVNSTEALEAMTDNAVWWLQETGIDGFRHDATKHVPYEFWKTLTRKIKVNVNPSRKLDVYQIGESFGGYDLIKSFVNPAMLDAQFSFNQFFTSRRIFVEKEGNFRDLNSAIEKALEVYGYNNKMGNIMDSHDQVRMMAFLDEDLTLSDNGTERAWQNPPIEVDHKFAYQKELVFLTYLLTVPGVPIIDYGDEFGMTGANDPDNRRMMRFCNELKPLEKEQLKNISMIINLRKNHSALCRGDYLNLFTNKDVMIYSRGDIYERLIVVLNKCKTEQTVTLNLPEWMNCKSWQSLIDKDSIEVNDYEISIRIPAYTGDVWIIKY